MELQYCESKSVFKERPLLSDMLFKFRVDSQNTNSEEYRSREHSFFEPPDHSKQKSLPSSFESIAVILPSIFEPNFVSFGDSKNLDSTVLRTCDFFW